MKKIVMVLAVLSVSLWAGDVVEQKVLLAMEKTPFKEALIENMELLLTSDNVAVTIIEDHENELEAVSAADYDALFITASGVNSMVRPWILTWIETNNEFSDKLIVHITKTREWDDGLTVDAVSSASSRGDVEELAQSYVSLLQDKLTASNEE